MFLFKKDSVVVICRKKSLIKSGTYFIRPKVIKNIFFPRMYHEPGVLDGNSIFFPMNWTFHLSCDRIRPNDCIFNPIRRAPTRYRSLRIF